MSVLSTLASMVPRPTWPGSTIVTEHDKWHGCAQIKVTGSGSGSPSLIYQILGIYNNSMKLFNGLNLWVDSVDSVEDETLETPVGDDVWAGRALSATGLVPRLL
ncbi:hypothetical protein PHISCL_05363 [Aspergillus sclerotialis]|uniref:Uncharacterized protein n=1 Tax=Aspergillus sclerotialis TaxID=2070753 RepID=A0A3A2ZGJ4_9EURO|nr:hypothetical protein PHISCL_05363 [Aspergillus sclerotialis]